MSKRTPKLVDLVDDFFHFFSGWAIAHRLIVVTFSLLLLAIGVYFAGQVRSDNSLDSFFNRADPAYIAYKEYLDQFYSDEVTYILYRVPESEHGPFDYEAMQKIAALTEALESEVPFVREVTSLTNVEFIRADGDSILIDELMIDFPDTQQELLKLREVVLDKPIYVDSLINQDATYAAIILEMTLSSIDSQENIIFDPEKGATLDNVYPQVSNSKVKEILDRKEYQGIEFYLTGDVPMNSAYNIIFTNDSAVGTLMTLALLALLSLLLFRISLVGLFGPLTVVVLSIILVLGLMGAVGWPITLFFGITPTLLCAVGVAQSVHIIIEYQRHYATSGSRQKAVQSAISKVGGACLMAALTTAFGFLVMYVSELKSLSQMALYSAVGVMLTLVFSVSLLVVFLAGGKSKDEANTDKSTTQNSGVNKTVERAVEFCINLNLNHGKTLITTGIVLLAISIVGLTQLKIDFNFLTEFKEHVDWRIDTEKAEEEMGGILNVAYIIDTGKTDGVKDPELLKAIDQLQTYASSLPFVKKTFSVVDIQKDLNRSFHGDDKEWYQVPLQQDLVAQYFLVYEISGGDELEDYVTPDFSSTVLELRVEITESSNVLALMQSIREYAQKNPLPGAEIRETGIGLMWIKIADYIGDTQIYGYSLIFIGIAVFLCIAFGSIRVGLLTMIPNVAPVVVVLGYMGLTGMYLDYMKLLLATIAIGIAVDDSIHLVTRFRRQFFLTGNYQKAMTLAMRDVGPALIITTLILIGAFSCYMLSDMQVITSFGLLLSLSIAVALIADLLFMPALLMAVKPFGKESDPDTHKEI